MSRPVENTPKTTFRCKIGIFLIYQLVILATGGLIMYWDPKIECMPKEEMKKMQYRSVKQLVNNLYSFNKFYHDRMKEQNVHPDDIQSLADVSKLPFM